MDLQDELPVVGREAEPLAAALGSPEPSSLERAERRVERLQRGDVRRAGALDGRGADGLVERAPQRLDLRQLGQRPSSGLPVRAPAAGAFV
ncbi:MAG: hypothetical protein H0V40_05725 [Actinobacteria bacterium]|nr:hypothetical protein [Actinomycetota bacterium]